MCPYTLMYVGDVCTCGEVYLIGSSGGTDSDGCEEGVLVENVIS